MARRFFALLALSAAFACTPDINIYVEDDDDDDEAMTSGFDTDMPMTSAGGSATNASAGSGNATASGGDPTGNATADPSGGDPTSDGGGESSGGDAPAEPYPQPVDGACPEGFGYNLDDGFEFCGLQCSDTGACPGATSGTVSTSCVFNPESSAEPCESDTCELPEESCFFGACALPPTHCAVLCSSESAVCPDGMECSNNNVCRFPAG